MQQITKLCADSLRTFIDDKYGARLKPTHAHELVAAFFGYKSNASLRADEIAPISNLRQAEIIVLAPTAPIDQRRQELEGLPDGLPDTYTLGEGVYSGLIAEKWILNTPWPVFELLAISFADGYLHQQGMANTYRSPLREGVKIEREESKVRLIVLRSYQVFTGGGGVRELQLTTTITLSRVAGYIGYGKPTIEVETNLGAQL